ncbi:hypothetical protein OsI_37837 [Oryza sativa Indica Group]|jgi:hypothetical protein|uniref:Uncharacterized protein n=2 Tax=Oryza TaxID=4527 RepID=A0A0E0CKC0_9ORYZ|nr:hypothetical protein OsI_37837 [Oryza sativa Indica Group]
MDGLVPLIFKVLKKKKAMRYYRSLSSSSSFSGTGGPPRIDDIVAAATMTTPRDHKLKVVTKPGGGAQRVAAMETLPRETFSPRFRCGGGAAAAVAPAIVGRSYLGGK